MKLLIGLFIFACSQLPLQVAQAASKRSDCEKELLRAAFWGETPRPQIVREPGHQEAIWIKIKQGKFQEAQAIEQAVVETLSHGQVIELMTADFRFVLLRFENDIQAIAKFVGATGAALMYRLDWELLQGRARVPITVVREIEGTPHSLQLWVNGALASKARPSPYLVFLDILSDNSDRSDGHNLLRSSFSRQVAIDNEMAFYRTDPYLRWAKRHCDMQTFSIQNPGKELGQFLDCLRRLKIDPTLLGEIARGVDRAALQRHFKVLTRKERSNARARFDLLLRF